MDLAESKYTLAQLATEAGVAPERIVEIRKLVALAMPGPDDVAFDDDDVQAFRILTKLHDAGVLDERAERSSARSLGQTMARLAEWQSDIMHDYVESNGGHADADAAVAELIGPIAELQNILWRKHLLDAVKRRSGEVERGEADTVAVGFADVVGYTSLSRGLDRVQLSAFLERFESEVADIVGRHGGRVIKMIGDEVMFVADEPVAAARIALELAAREREFDGRPELRVGLAYGRVLRQLGDVHGVVVNVATRLTAVARPGSVLADDGLAAALDDHPEFSIRSLRRVDVKGFSRLQPWLLRSTSR